MQAIHVSVEGDNAWADLRGKRDEIVIGQVTHVAGLAGGVVSGKPSVAFRILLPHQEIVAEMSLAMLQTINRMLTAKYGNIEGGD